MKTPTVAEQSVVDVPGSGKCRVLYAIDEPHWVNPKLKGYKVENVWTGNRFSVWL